MLAAIGAPFVSIPAEANYDAMPPDKDPWRGLKPGIASYTFRKFSVDDTVKCKSRLYDLHLKDISSTEPNGHTVPGGRGVLDLNAIMKSIVKVKYTHLISVEYEESADDPVPEVAETIGYAKGLLRAMK